MTASMLHVINLTPGSDNPKRRLTPRLPRLPRPKLPAAGGAGAAGAGVEAEVAAVAWREMDKTPRLKGGEGIERTNRNHEHKRRT